MADQIPVRIPNIVTMLEDGKTREEIGEHYGLNKADTRRLFKHPQLKGRRPHKKPSFIVVEELEETPTNESPQRDFRDVPSESDDQI